MSYVVYIQLIGKKYGKEIKDHLLYQGKDGQ